MDVWYALDEGDTVANSVLWKSSDCFGHLWRWQHILDINALFGPRTVDLAEGARTEECLNKNENH